MGLFRALSSGAAAAADVSAVKGGRKEIFAMRDRLRNTPQFSEAFYKLVSDVSHPPCNIEATQSGDFWSMSWMPAYNNYEPYTTQKFSDRNIGYIEGCAIYLLIQECYPDVYDFPGNTIRALSEGATIKLIMKKNFIGQHLQPAYLPQRPVQQPAYQQMPPVQQAPVQNAFRFCTNCGTKNDNGSKFCFACGNKIG